MGGMNNSNPMGIYGFSNATLCAFAEPGSEDGTPLRVPVSNAHHAQLIVFPVLLTPSCGRQHFMPCCWCCSIPAERRSRVWHLWALLHAMLFLCLWCCSTPAERGSRILHLLRLSGQVCAPAGAPVQLALLVLCQVADFVFRRCVRLGACSMCAGLHACC